MSAPALFPAIDIMGGKAVRLTRGRFDRSKVYEQHPLAAARRWVEEGARALHVVDLDGAREGRPLSLDHLREIAKLPVPVQYGGGLRELESMAAALEAGASRVVLGTAAFCDPELLDSALERFRERIAVSIDVRDGRVATSGWVEQVELSGPEAVCVLKKRGAARFVYTNVDRDGTMQGLDPEDFRKASEAVGGDRFLYSGGIGSLGDLVEIAAISKASLEGVIVGKALYEQRFRLRDGQRALESSPAEELSSWS